MKITIEDVEAVLLEQKVDRKAINETIIKLQEIAEENKSESDPKTKTKNQFVVVVSDPDNKLQGESLPTWIVQIKADDDHSTVLDRVRSAACEYNANSKKGRKNPLKTFGEVFQNIKRSFLKEKNVAVKTKEPVIVLITDNQIMKC